MNRLLPLTLRLSLCLMGGYSLCYCQPSANKAAPTALQQVQSGLFSNDSLLDIRLSGNLRELFDDRGEKSQYHPLSIGYRDAANVETTIKINAKTRGHFRKMKENCSYPPLLLHFSKSETPKSSLFGQQSKLKLVMPCRGDEFVVREWMIYKLYNLITPLSFQARLVRVSLEDSRTKSQAPSFYGILLEEQQQLAARNGTINIERKLRPEQVALHSFLTMAVFEYLIGNTDWSIQYLQNVKLLATDSNAVPVCVAYDFDHAGMVNAPYALPAEELQMNSVRQRRYRGYCIQDMHQFDEVLAMYDSLKKDIYALYTGSPILDEKSKKYCLKYLDEFYEDIHNPATLKKDFQYPCNKNGTGNVVIKGYRED